MNKLIHTIFFILISTIVWSQDGVILNYEIDQKNSDSHVLRLKVKLKNQTDQDIYFLSESCNGLDYYLSTVSDSTKISIIHHCNASYPIKNKLKANSTFEFNASVALLGEANKIGLKLKLVVLSKTYLVEGKFIHQIAKENSYQTIQLKGPDLNTD